MGYETKLIIGYHDDRKSPVYKRSDTPVIEDESYLYYPYETDANGDWIKDGDKTDTYFSKVAEIDLCKLGSDSAVSKINWVNEDPEHGWYFYADDGNTQITEDRYDERSKPIPIEMVISALKHDVKSSEYRRLKWALGLLEAMRDDGSKQKYKVLFYGH